MKKLKAERQLLKVLIGATQLIIDGCVDENIAIAKQYNARFRKRLKAI